MRSKRFRARERYVRERSRFTSFEPPVLYNFIKRLKGDNLI